METFFTSDTHFGHKKIIEFQATRSQFKTIEEHDEALVRNWNARVGSDDLVYHLGDVSMCNARLTADILVGLKGTIHLIRGNHDRHMNGFCKKRFTSIQDYLEVKRKSGKHIVLSHYPFQVWRDSHWGSWHLHGHSHGSMPPIGRRLDVGIDCHSLAPISLDEVYAILHPRTPSFEDYHGREGYVGTRD